MVDRVGDLVLNPGTAGPDETEHISTNNCEESYKKNGVPLGRELLVSNRPLPGATLILVHQKWASSQIKEYFEERRTNFEYDGPVIRYMNPETDPEVMFSTVFFCRRFFEYFPVPPAKLWIKEVVQ